MNQEYLALTLVLLLLALGAWAGNRLRRWWARRGLSRRFRHAREGEDSARDYLESHGFRVLGAQVEKQCTLLVDGVETPFVVRADYMVERDGNKAIVEVKTGAVANPGARETRRQILEYSWTYGVNSVYLFNADAQRLQRIGIPDGQPVPARIGAGRRTTWYVGFGAGLIGGIALASFLGI